ncbi:MAG: hypothetical protein AAGD04_13910 [Pseudomonadota bacterium]
MSYLSRLGGPIALCLTLPAQAATLDMPASQLAITPPQFKATAFIRAASRSPLWTLPSLTDADIKTPIKSTAFKPHITRKHRGKARIIWPAPKFFPQRPYKGLTTMPLGFAFFMTMAASLYIIAQEAQINRRRDQRRRRKRYR